MERVMGRPRSEDPRSRRVAVNFTVGEFRAVEDTARQVKLPVQEFCRRRILLGGEKRPVRPEEG